MTTLFRTDGWGLLWGFLLLASCAPSPLFPPEAVRDAGAPIRVATIVAKPEQYTGHVLQMGGEIIQVQPVTEGQLLIVHELPIVEKPMVRPAGDGPRTADFTVLYPGKLRPVDAVVGNRLIVIGQMEGIRTALGQDKALPAIRARCVAIWETSGEGVYHYLLTHGGEGFPDIEQTYCPVQRKNR